MTDTIQPGDQVSWGEGRDRKYGKALAPYRCDGRVIGWDVSPNSGHSATLISLSALRREVCENA